MITSQGSAGLKASLAQEEGDVRLLEPRGVVRTEEERERMRRRDGVGRRDDILGAKEI